MAKGMLPAEADRPPWGSEGDPSHLPLCRPGNLRGPQQHIPKGGKKVPQCPARLSRLKRRL
jgi:hypothetical protein